MGGGIALGGFAGGGAGADFPSGMGGASDGVYGMGGALGSNGSFNELPLEAELHVETPLIQNACELPADPRLASWDE